MRGKIIIKRLLEFILSLTGAILGVFTAFGDMSVIMVEGILNNESLKFSGLISNFVGIFIGILAIICTCIVEKKTKLASKLFIICGIILFLTNFYQAIPATLLIVAGCVGLKRKVD